MWYFDPTNYVYSAALSIMTPQLDTNNWDSRTRGEILESLLGVAYLGKHSFRVEEGKLRCMEQVAAVAHTFCVLTWRLFLRAEVLSDCVNWTRTVSCQLKQHGVRQRYVSAPLQSKWAALPFSASSVTPRPKPGLASPFEAPDID